ncbi:hypothetical protein [Lentiprolixibacter aurantiacus]|uniref:Viral A-type inclusion protein n=1 Tax=Lentiprolixibacter aurantiacus TaxID=2993939 RepID=A0AAE3SM74_9FLAO|nr:hypothetical protein [Lentiprolixibacter aurantiacus]MCX2718274.1 hypothetical protein [Lentiprolixibacter aurantiacus]
MRASFISLLILSSLILSISCKEEKTGKNPSRMEEVVAIHDMVMPEMKTIGQLVSELQPLVDSTATGQEYARALDDLKAAHKSMMDWMSGFGERFNSEEIFEGKALSEQKQQWLLEEEVKVRAMQEQVNSSIEQARALLKKN